MTYAQKLKSPKWQRRRLEILKRDKFKCKKCGDTETTLHVHHLSYHGEPWEAPSKELDTLCEHCHNIVEWLLKCKEFTFNYVEFSVSRFVFLDGNIVLDAGIYGIHYVSLQHKHIYHVLPENSGIIREEMKMSLA